MLDYKNINEKMDKLKNKYEFDVSNFKKYSPIGNVNYDYQNINFEFELNKIKNENENLESNSNHTNQTIKKLLKVIHPDKIKLIFDEDIPELHNCSQQIIQKNLNFTDSIILLQKNLTKEIFNSICKKIDLDETTLNKILNIEYEKNIDNHFDQEFLDLVKKYNQMQSKTLYNYINSRVTILFSNINSHLNELLSRINKILDILDPSYGITENILMAREEFRLEYWLNNKEIDISDLTLYYPESKFAKTFTLITENLSIKLGGNIKIQRFMYYGLNVPKETHTECTKYLYNKFIN